MGERVCAGGQATGSNALVNENLNLRDSYVGQYRARGEYGIVPVLYCKQELCTQAKRDSDSVELDGQPTCL